MSDGPGAGAANPIGFTFAVSDTAARRYSGAMILPNGALAPLRKLASTSDALTWELPNSGGGNWVYTAKLVGRDSLAGTLVLRGAPWNPEKDPSGTFALARRVASTP